MDKKCEKCLYFKEGVCQKTGMKIIKINYCGYYKESKHEKAGLHDDKKV